MVVVDAAGRRVSHAGIKACVLLDGGNIGVAGRIRQVVEKEGTRDGQPNGAQTTRDEA